MVQGTSVKPCGGVVPPPVVHAWCLWMALLDKPKVARRMTSERASSAALLLGAFEGWERAQAEAFAARRALSGGDGAGAAAR